MSVATTDEDSYRCDACGAIFNTILERWTLPAECWKCGERHPWTLVEDAEGGKEGSR